MAEICQRYHIRRLLLFGSVLKGTARPDSDLDFLVEFELGHVPDMLTIVGIEEELSGERGGRRVDLQQAQDLSRLYRTEVIRAAEAQYAT